MESTRTELPPFGAPKIDEGDIIKYILSLYRKDLGHHWIIFWNCEIFFRITIHLYSEINFQVQIEDKTCTGVGPNKKLAKRHAAEQMLTLLGYNKPSPQPTKPAIKQATSPEVRWKSDN